MEDNLINGPEGTVLTKTGPLGHEFDWLPPGDIDPDSLELTDADIDPVAGNAQTGTTYTFELDDAHRMVTATNSSAQTYTIPLAASVAFPLWSVVSILVLGSGQVTWAIAGGGTLRIPRGGKSEAQYTISSAMKIGTNEWVVFGDVTE